MVQLVGGGSVINRANTVYLILRSQLGMLVVMTCRYLLIPLVIKCLVTCFGFGFGFGFLSTDCLKKK